MKNPFAASVVFLCYSYYFLCMCKREREREREGGVTFEKLYLF